MTKDLLVLAADRNMEHAVKGLLSRPEALRIRPIEADILVHPRRDPGCVREGVRFLSNLSQRYRHGLLMFDHQGSGREQEQPEALQESVEKDFSRSAWGDRARVIILAPELEAWIWSGSPHVDDAAGWSGRKPPLRAWLRNRGLLAGDLTKPSQPKKAFEAALREARKPRSSSLYRQIAEKASLQKCEDKSFRKFKSLLQDWYPER